MGYHKVFIGFEDIASQIKAFADGFRANGCDTLTAVFDSSTPKQLTKVDFNVAKDSPQLEWFEDKQLGEQVVNTTRDNLKNHIWQRAIQECDVFFFIWHTFKPDHADLAELKRLGKKIIVFCVGSDIRWYYAMEQQFGQFGLPPMPYDEAHRHVSHLHRVVHRLRSYEKYVDVLCSSPPQSELALRPYYNMGVPIQMEYFRENTQQRDIPKIIHAPSWPERKGSAIIKETIDRLEAEGVRFEFQYIENMPHEEAIRCYEDADILVGQMFGLLGGKQEREVLACGTIVLSSIGRAYITGTHGGIPVPQYEECPIIDVSPATLYEELKAIILDLPKRKEIAKQGRAWADKYHNTVNITKRMIEKLEYDDENYDYFPTFFKEEFIPRNPENTALLNKYSQYVNDTWWYQKYVQGGERSGLIFPYSQNIPPAKAQGSHKLVDAIEYYKQRDYAAAAELLRDVLDAEPANIDAHFYIACISLEVGNTESAKSVIEAILPNAPHRIDLQRKHAEILIKSGAYEEGIGKIHELLKKQPDDISSLNLMYNFLIQTGRAQDALVFKQRIEQIQSSPL